MKAEVCRGAPTILCGFQAMLSTWPAGSRVSRARPRNTDSHLVTAGHQVPQPPGEHHRAAPARVHVEPHVVSPDTRVLLRHVSRDTHLMKVLLHLKHTYGLSPVWERVCCTRCEDFCKRKKFRICISGIITLQLLHEP